MRDVIVVGAGLAGASAALKLSRSGFTVTIIEARSRTGGRAYSRPFAGFIEEEQLEFGGSWITPWHTRIRALCVELDIKLRPRQTITSRLWMMEGVSQTEGAVRSKELKSHERALARIAADATLLKSGHTINEKGETLTGISYAGYIERLNPPVGTRDMLNAWWSVSGSGNHNEVVASEFLSSCSYGDGLAEAMIDFWSDTVSPGMSTLVERMIKKSSAQSILDTPVIAINQSATEVEISSQDGRVFRSSFIVVALGINMMKDIAFSPPVPPRMAAIIARGHAGKGFKVWIKARGIELGTLVSGNSEGIELLFAERRAADDTVLLVGFGLDQGGAQPGDPKWVKNQLSKLVPNAEFLCSDTHDWTNDPYALGTWVSAPVGYTENLDPKNWGPQGTMTFASSDYAPDQAGWFEGAVVAGEAAADKVLELSKKTASPR